MNLRTWAGTAAALVCGCLTIGGCGGQAASRHERDQVRQFVPDARAIRCSHDRGPVTRCQALVGNAPARIERWDCEFTFEADREQGSYAGTQSCWSSH
jgi:hypothetical protein